MGELLPKHEITSLNNCWLYLKTEKKKIWSCFPSSSNQQIGNSLRLKKFLTSGCLGLWNFFWKSFHYIKTGYPTFFRKHWEDNPVVLSPRVIFPPLVWKFGAFLAALFIKRCILLDRMHLHFLKNFFSLKIRTTSIPARLLESYPEEKISFSGDWKASEEWLLLPAAPDSSHPHFHWFLLFFLFSVCAH